MLFLIKFFIIQILKYYSKSFIFDEYLSKLILCISLYYYEIVLRISLISKQIKKNYILKNTKFHKISQNFTKKKLNFFPQKKFR